MAQAQARTETMNRVLQRRYQHRLVVSKLEVWAAYRIEDGVSWFAFV